MRQLLRSLFGRAPAVRTEHGLRSLLHPREAHGPTYDAELIGELLQAQHALELRLQSVLACHRAHDMGTWWYELEKCDHELADYLLAEGHRFEGYMRHVLEPNAESMRLMRKLRVRLREAARTVHGLVESNGPRPLSPHAVDLLGEQVTAVEANLKHCFLTLQDQLFPLYQPISPEADQVAARNGGSR
jgi:hypothetical protein